MESLGKGVRDERVSKYENILNSYHDFDVYDGKAQFLERDTIIVKTDSNNKKLKGYNFIIATGSSPKIPRIDGLKETGYITSSTVLDLNNLPKTLAIIGGSFIGLEIGQSLRRLGTSVPVAKKLNTI